MLEGRRYPGSAGSSGGKEWCGGRRLGVERPKWLSQILEERARQLEIRGVEAFREAVVDEGERIPGLIALATSGEHAGPDHRRPQLPSQRRLRACNRDRFGQAVHG